MQQVEYALQNRVGKFVTRWTPSLQEIRQWHAEFSRDVPGWAPLVIIQRTWTVVDTPIE